MADLAPIEICVSSDTDATEKGTHDETMEANKEEYEQNCYENLRKGNDIVKISDNKYVCPYCPKMKKLEFRYKALLCHASELANEVPEGTSPNQKITHMALVKYLKNDLSDAATGDEYVWPWTGVAVNILRTRAADGRFIGSSGTKLKNDLIQRGLKLIRVHPLWNFRGFSGCSLIEFGRDWPAFFDAISFEKAFSSDSHGKEDWENESIEKDGIYCWIARSDDYNGDDIVADHLRRTGNLKTITELVEEETKKQNMFESDLNNLIDEKERYIKEMECKCSTTYSEVRKVMEETEKLTAAYNEEIKKMEASARSHYQRVMDDHMRLKEELERHKRKLELHNLELEKREVKNEKDRQLLAEEKEKSAVMKKEIDIASNMEKLADNNLVNLAERQKREKDELHRRALMLEKQLDDKQALDLEIERLEGSLNVMKHMDVDKAKMEEWETLLNDLREKEEKQRDLEESNNSLINKERTSNIEVQEARKELIKIFGEVPKLSRVGIKRMGELKSEAFVKALKRKYGEEEAQVQAVVVCSEWEQELRDSSWHPFRVVSVEGEEKEILKEDEKLRVLREEIGEGAHDAVVTALMELNEYNASGRYAVLDLWNYDLKRKATLKESFSTFLRYFLSLKRKTSF